MSWSQPQFASLVCFGLSICPGLRAWYFLRQEMVRLRLHFWCEASSSLDLDTDSRYQDVYMHHILDELRRTASG